MKRHMTTLIIMLAFALPAGAQGINLGNIDLSSSGEVNIDRFGKPVFGLRAQREPELRRMRKQAGRPVLEGFVDIYDIDMDVFEDALNTETSSSGASPKIKCIEQSGEIICKAE